VFEKGLFLANVPDAPDDHYLGAVAQQMLQMIRFGRFFEPMGEGEFIAESRKGGNAERKGQLLGS
jgi:hypothetical protein